MGQGTSGTAPLPVDVHEAQELVSVQASCSVADALLMMRHTAEATGETLEYVAGEVLKGTVRFDAR
jgi:hypothetical protein